MKNSLNKSVLISSSLIFALVALSSCGKSKDLKSAPPTAQTTQVPQQTPPQTVAPPAPPAGNTLTQPDNTLTQPLDPNANQIPNNNLIPQGPQAQPNNSNQGSETLPPLPVGPALDPQANQTNVLRPPLQPVKKENQKAYQIDFKAMPSVKTGGQSNDLFYTSAGDDSLMEEFKSYNSKVAVNQQVMNTNLAKAIVVAKLSRSNSSGEVAVNLTVDEFGTLKTYKLIATTEADKMKLTLSKTGTTGEMDFQGGFLKCLDQNGGCEVAYAKMKFAGGYTRVIFRNSMSDMHFLLEENVSNNAGFSLWSKYILNAANALDTAQRVEALQLSSFEVVNGRAGMGALLTTADHEILGLSIPMVVSATNSDVRAPIAKVSDLSKNFDLAPLAKSYSTNLSSKVNEARLVNNNGRGQFKVQLQMGTEADSASVWIVAARVQQDILSVEQIRTFESKLKAF